MKKTLTIIAACLLVGTASAQDLTCKGMLQQSDSYIPSLCDTGSKSVDFSIGLEAPPPPEFTVSNAKITQLTWDDARKICARHISYITWSDNPKMENEHYDGGFEEVCREVDGHFESEAQRAKDIVDQADLHILRQFLEVSK